MKQVYDAVLNECSCLLTQWTVFELVKLPSWTVSRHFVSSQSRDDEIRNSLNYGVWLQYAFENFWRIGPIGDYRFCFMLWLMLFSDERMENVNTESN